MNRLIGKAPNGYYLTQCNREYAVDCDPIDLRQAAYKKLYEYEQAEQDDRYVALPCSVERIKNAVMGLYDSYGCLYDEIGLPEDFSDCRKHCFQCIVDGFRAEAERKQMKYGLEFRHNPQLTMYPEYEIVNWEGETCYTVAVFRYNKTEPCWYLESVGNRLVGLDGAELMREIEVGFAFIAGEIKEVKND